MGDFWDDIKKKNEERRIAGIRSDIRVLEEQIKEYEDAKKKVESATTKSDEAKNAVDILKQNMTSYDTQFEGINTDITDEVKYDLIFSDKISRFVFNFFNTIRSPLEYYDPDTSYQEDVDAFMSAFNEKVNFLDNPKTQQMIQDYLSL